MNDDKECKDTCKENNPSPNGGNKGVTSSVSGGVSDTHPHHPFSSMGPNHNHHQYHSHHHQHDSKIGGGSGSTINSNNSHSNGGGGSNHLNNNSANGSSNGNLSSSSAATSNNFSSEVCRDFLRNVCRRGVNCRYRHPEGSEAEELGKKVDLIFCHDYQNKECRRSNCRFIHCTKQEEEIYRATGKLPHLIEKLSYSRLTSTSSPSPSSSFNHHHHHHPLHQHHHQHADFMKSVVCDNSNNNNGLTSNSSIASNLASSFVSSLASSLSSSLTSSVASSSTVASPFSTPIPVCKDNLKGDCLRGLRCKFRHISQAEYDLELRSAAAHSAGGVRPSSIDRNQYHHHLQVPPPGSLMDSPSSYQGGLAPPEPKRRAYDTSLGFGPQPPFTHPLSSHPQHATSSLNHPGLSSFQPQTSNDFEFPKPPPPPHTPQNLFNNSRFLEDENFTLRRHIEELKKQVTDLMASNEFLIEQNAQLRTLGTRSTTPLTSSLHSGSSTSVPHSNESYIGSRPGEQHQQQQQHLPVAFATTLSAQTAGGIPVSSMAALSTNPLVSYPIMTTSIQSLRPPTVSHSLSH